MQEQQVVDRVQGCWSWSMGVRQTTQGVGAVADVPWCCPRVEAGGL
ncbi:hypothetical protein [Streptomyces bambusae]|uniref:Uncharacterized protein n=1 Tax=Streptomyces bambusae TaxID=1550616 RepID=A0ABS6Z1K5_9ACTN|nr:hypothetical protein [Streptomyces bambusae]MBW5480635.1 hypothetical protein [Streptomyces bambusae]